MGNKVYKINLHMHTTLSDGAKTPEEAAKLYKEAGYDAVAVTDHWKPSEEGDIDGLHIFAGCEYDFGDSDTDGGAVYHIVSLMCDRDPGVTRKDSVDSCIDKIHEAGGIAVLAHPAWSLNNPAEVASHKGFDATEIYNSVSAWGASNRPYSGGFVDILAGLSVTYPLIATDDTHYYGRDGQKDGPNSAIMVSLPELTKENLINAIRSGDFYATSGGENAPALKVERKGDRIIADCSEVCTIDFFSNMAWSAGRHVTGKNLTHAEYTIGRSDKRVRVEVTDREGKKAYSSFIVL